MSDIKTVAAQDSQAPAPTANTASTETQAQNPAPSQDAHVLGTSDFRGVMWRSFTLMSSFNYERMQALGFLYGIMKPLRKIYSGDDDGLRAAMRRHMAAFNMTCAPSTFVMGITLAMEEMFAKDKTLDTSAVNSIKVSLMGPLSGIGDTFFWGIFRVLACSLGVSFAAQGNPIAPFILLFAFNLPNFVVRWFGIKLGYFQGSSLIEKLERGGQMKLVTHCAGIIGAVSIGTMIAMWVSINCPLTFNMGEMKIVIQDYLDQIIPKLLPLVATLGVYGALKKNVKTGAIIAGLVVAGFVLGVTGVIAM